MQKGVLGKFSNVFSGNEIFVHILKHWIFELLIFILQQLSINIWVWDFALFVEVSPSCFVNLSFCLNTVNAFVLIFNIVQSCICGIIFLLHVSCYCRWPQISIKILF